MCCMLYKCSWIDATGQILHICHALWQRKDSVIVIEINKYGVRSVSFLSVYVCVRWEQAGGRHPESERWMET